MSEVVTIDDVRAARRRLVGSIHETPCPYSQTLSELTGTRCFVKLESLQMTGSFKERGATNVLLQLSERERQRGVITASAGNHGLAVAFHAARLGIGATIVMPDAAPLVKVTSARRCGAEVILHGASYDAAHAHARELQRARGVTFVHPFDDARVIAGQGTIGLEIVEQCPEVEAVLVPLGGGGLIGGVATAVKALRPEARVIGVQARSLPSIADGIAVKGRSALTSEIIEARVDGLVTVDDEEIANAILLLLEIEKAVAEGAGATPLAALVNRPLGLSGRTVVLVLSGGNIDVTMVSRIIERGLVKDGRLVRLAVVLADRPGALARLTALVGEARANILHIEHDRAFAHAAVGESEVELTLETSGLTHIEAIRRRLEESGYRTEDRHR